MSRINKMLVFLLAILMMFPAFSESDLINVNDIVLETAANYNTVEVKKGVLRKTSFSPAQAYYPIEHVVRYEGAPAQFVEFHVKRNEEIKKGDLIATFVIQRDEVQITRMNMDISQTELNYQKGLEARNEQLLKKDEEIALSPDPFIREIRMMEKEKLLVERDKYIYETENSIKDKKQALEDLISTYENTSFYSEVDGVISEIAYFRDLAYVYSGTQLMKVYDPDTILYRVDDSTGRLRYNMEVMVSVGRADNRVTGAGRVYACPMAMPGGTGDNYAYIRVNGFDKPPKTQTSPSVAYDEQYLENIFVVEREAVSLFGGRYFVYKLSDDGMVSKRYVGFAFGSQKTGAVLVDGVKVGDKLIIDE